MRLEQGIGNLTLPEFEPNFHPRTALFIADDTNEDNYGDQDGSHYVYSDLMAGSSEVFRGTITELYADANYVLAAKSGEYSAFGPDIDNSGFAQEIEGGILVDTETGALYLENTSGELLIFNTRNTDGQFGLPYLLVGRLDMPYKDVFGVAR